ncbi:MAG TPA: hypothetical protein VHL34_00455 [Rhizomicrobium sp.]|nr:hypothetical protein [Rhizomicrobium sp.]
MRRLEPLFHFAAIVAAAAHGASAYAASSLKFQKIFVLCAFSACGTAISKRKFQNSRYIGIVEEGVAGMARGVICLGVLALGVAFISRASAQPQKSGYQTVSHPVLIDPRMQMLGDGPQQDQQQKASPRSQTPPAAQGTRENGMPLDQMGGDDSADVPAGDDPMSDNAVETDTVYTA